MFYLGCWSGPDIKLMHFNYILYFIKIDELSTSAYQVLRKHFHKHSPVSLPTDVSLTLHTEGVISKETFNEVEKSGGFLADSSLRALSNAVSEDPDRLRVFTNVLLQSEDTVRVAKDILKEYGK